MARSGAIVDLLAAWLCATSALMAHGAGWGGDVGDLPARLDALLQKK